MSQRKLFGLSTLTGISLITLVFSGCVQVRTTPSGPDARADFFVEEIELPYSQEYIVERWKILRQAKKSGDSTVRSTSNWTPDSYGPLGYESSSLLDDPSVIYRAYESDGKNFLYCVSECKITIKLTSQVRTRTKAKITYYNAGGIVSPFVEEMRAGLKFYLDK